MLRFFNKFFIIILIATSSLINADSFRFNSYNNHGVVGLINTPSARFFNEGVHGISLYSGNPDQKITLTSSPYDWLEASFFYMNISDIKQCRQGTTGKVFCQGYKDKGFNMKLRLKEEGLLPAVAIGLNDFAGTGIYSSEYLVASYGRENIDFHFGLGWGQLDGLDSNIKNPLTYINDSFRNRPAGYEGKGGQFNPSKYFSGKTSSFFYGISYSYNNNLLIKIEKDPTSNENSFVQSLTKFKKRKNNYTFGIDYSIYDSFSVGASYERGNYFSLKFLYKNNPNKSIKKYKYKKPEVNDSDDRYSKLIKNLEENGIGVNKITETSKSIGLELTQFIHPDINLIEQIIKEASREAGIKKDIKKDIKTADLVAISEIDDTFKRNAELIYNRESNRIFNTSNRFRFRPFLASREEFFKGALMYENDSEFIVKENLFINTNIKYSVANNFDDLSIPPVDVFPAQVRSDIKQYLKNMDSGILIGRAQFDYHLTPKLNHHLMLSGGILEDMFSGIGMEYLYFQQNKNYSFGFELFKVRKRDYDWGFGHLEYENTTLTLNYFLRNYGSIPFDLKISAGEYLAGDVGTTFEMSRTLRNGVMFGAFATFTDVSTEDFGEGSFDKGIFFKIPIYGNLINYTWRPLTKDPGAKLNRRNTLNSLLVRYKPNN
jgi:hypothetical protein